LIQLITSSDVQQFMSDHEHEDLTRLALRFSSKVTFDLTRVLEQMKLRRKALSKLGEFVTPYTILLPKLFEQSTGEQIAKFKGEIFQGKSILDATAGLGSDAYFIGRNFEEVICLEADAGHAELLKHNLDQLEFKPMIKAINLEEFLKTNSLKYDIIYIDPDRRPSRKRVLFNIADYSPDVTLLKTALLDCSEAIWIKLSPMMDLNYIEAMFSPNLSWVYCISYKNEMKEILICLQNGMQTTVRVAVSLDRAERAVYSSPIVNRTKEASEPLTYFFEPDVALIKSGLDSAYAKANNFQPLYPSGFYYTSNNTIREPQGRIFEIIEKTKYEKQLLTNIFKLHGIKGINISVRNFFWEAEQIRQQLKLKDGGAWYLFCYVDASKEPVALVCRKIKHLPSFDGI